MKTLTYFLALTISSFTISAQADLLHDIIGYGKPGKLDVRSCPSSFSLDISDIRKSSFDKLDSSLNRASQNLSQIKLRSLTYILTEQDNRQGLCHYQSSNNETHGVLYIMGTKQYPQVAFSTSLDLEGRLEANILVDTISIGGLLLKERQVVSIWAQSDGNFPVEVGTVRINN